MNMPDETFASSGHATVARRLYDMAGVGAGDIDVAQIYDPFTSQVIMQIEDYGFCAKGEGEPFVASGPTRIDGSLPVNTAGRQLTSGLTWGTPHVRHAVAQMRSVSAPQT